VLDQSAGNTSARPVAITGTLPPLRKHGYPKPNPSGTRIVIPDTIKLMDSEIVCALSEKPPQPAAHWPGKLIFWRTYWLEAEQFGKKRSTLGIAIECA
jgi:hypothetical protein